MNTERTELSIEGQRIAQMLASLIESKLIDVPMLPEVANKALILSQDPESDASAMAKLVQSDQSLAGHVMRIANSVAYTPLTNLVSLQQAVARLGMGIISEIALSASIGAKLFKTPGHEQHIAAQWQHALATGLWAKEVARQTRSNVEVAFLAGLLHSIGRPASLQTILNLAKQQNVSLSHDEILALEDRYQHQTSSMLVNSWKMPTLVIEAIEHYPGYAEAPTAAMQAAQVNAAIQYATHMLNPEQLDRDTLLALPVLEVLNIYQDEAEKLLDKSQAIAEKLKELAS
jgi:HD-like signal output (HDOD) protein